MKITKKLAYVVPAFLVGTIASSTIAVAAIHSVNVEQESESTLSVNGRQASKMPRFEYGKTTYVGLWWLQSALEKLGIPASWDGNNFKVTIPSGQNSSIGTTNGIHASTFATVSSNISKPDDITELGGNIYVAYQNGVGTKGESSSSGVTTSTIVEYNTSGHMLKSWNITGKCDGMTGDTANNRILATVNEDGNSSMYIIAPGQSTTQHLTYSPDPSSVQSGPIATGGGTDSIAIQNGHLYISASNPTPDSKGNFTHAALFEGTIQGNTVNLSPVVMGNSTATDVASGNSTTLNLSDPDSSTVVPASSPKFAGDVALDSQADGELIFVKNAGTSSQSLSRLTLGTQIDDSAWATASKGTLYVTDNSTNTVSALSIQTTPGTVFVACPSDSGVAGCVGTLNLSTGTITPIAVGFTSPQGLLYVPNNE